MNYSKFLIALAVVAIFWTEARATNLVTNGGFESGNTGFSSDYTYSTDLGPEGVYSVVSDASTVHPAFTGSPYAGSKFFVGNGGPDVNAAVWRSQVVQVTQPGIAYRFEAQISSMVPVTNQEEPETDWIYDPVLDDWIPVLTGNTIRNYDGPELFFEIGNGTSWTPLGSTLSIADGATPGNWFFTFADGAFGQAGDYYIQLRNNSTVFGGNDFGIDNIFFGLRTDAPSYPGTPGDANPAIYNPAGVPEPSSASLLLAGIGGLMALRLRRKS